MIEKKKLYFVLFLCILFALAAISPLISSENNKIDKKVMDKFDDEDSVRVFVKFKEDLSVKGLQSAKTSFSDSFGKKVKHKFDDYVSMAISESDLLELENNPNVKSVEIVDIKKIVLNDSVPLIGGNYTHNIHFNGFNLTGEGETVCILDTGVDFTHTALDGRNLTEVIDCFNGDCVENASAGDYDGHGTHVAGIVASSNGLYQGVAPNVNLIGVKVCGPGGCPNDDIIKGINWCVSNASLFDISVISISLASSILFDSYCDADDPLIASSINNAVTNNISVIVASSNDGSSTNISSPACIKNAIAVGSTTKSDSIASYSNRNNITDLFAPGSDITSTFPGGYAILSGTSMATPHVAGAFALINQFKRLEGKSISPLEIQTSLNDTGKQIYDVGFSGLNFSRINVYAAILSLDETGPTITITVPQNISYNTNVSELNYSVSDLMLDSCWYSRNEGATNSSIDITCSNFTNVTSLVGNNTWTVYANDSSGNENSASISFTKDLISPIIQFVAPTELSGVFKNQSFVLVNVTASDSELDSIVIRLYDSTSSLIDSNVTKAPYRFINFSGLADGLYSYNATANDTLGNSASLTTRTITLDTIKPIIALTSPTDGDDSKEGGTNVDFVFNLTETNPDQCKLVVIGETNNTQSAINGNNTITKNLDSGNYDWYVECYDLAGNIDVSGIRSLEIKESSSGGGSGGSSSSSSGGGSSSRSVTSIITGTIHTLSEKQVAEGINKLLGRGDRVEFKIDGESHNLVVDSVSDNEISITVQSDPISLSIEINETQKVDLEDDNFYDLRLFLNSIENSKADLEIKSIHEKISEENAEENNESGALANIVSIVDVGGVFSAILVFINSVTGSLTGLATNAFSGENSRISIYIAIGILVIAISVASFFIFKKISKKKALVSTRSAGRKKSKKSKKRSKSK